MCHQREGDISVVWNDLGSSQNVDFAKHTPHIFVKNKEHQGGMEQDRRKESFVQPRKVVSGDAD